jgi:hypothetical protein
VKPPAAHVNVVAPLDEPLVELLLQAAAMAAKSADPHATRRAPIAPE